MRIFYLLLLCNVSKFRARAKLTSAGKGVEIGSGAICGACLRSGDACIGASRGARIGISGACIGTRDGACICSGGICIGLGDVVCI